MPQQDAVASSRLYRAVWRWHFYAGLIVALNALFCLMVIFACVSGVVMWWMRRPAGRMGVPAYPRDFRLGFGMAAIALAVGIAFPLGGVAILVLAIIDFLLPARLKEAGVSSN